MGMIIITLLLLLALLVFCELRFKLAHSMPAENIRNDYADFKKLTAGSVLPQSS